VQVTEFLWDGNALAVELSSEHGARVHVHAPGTLVPMLQAEGGEVFAVVCDHLGMPKELLGQDGRVAWAAAHSAWGRVVEVKRAGNVAGARPLESPVRLLGQYTDEETGLCYTRFRYFDPQHGRWMSPDPLGVLGGLNLLAFNGRPTVDVDPLGLMCGGGNEVYYRAMSQAHYDELVRTGKLPATRETFISPTQGYSEDYDGVLVRFEVEPGTTAELEGMGVRDNSALAQAEYPDMPLVQRGWGQDSAFFKGEGDQINIGLGRGTALDTFNSKIVGFDVVPR
jgi:RHS repeat-associated protein